MGMNAANANFACLWCTIHKDKRLGASLFVLISFQVLTIEQMGYVSDCRAV